MEHHDICAHFSSVFELKLRIQTGFNNGSEYVKPLDDYRKSVPKNVVLVIFLEKKFFEIINHRYKTRFRNH